MTRKNLRRADDGALAISRGVQFAADHAMHRTGATAVLARTKEPNLLNAK
jgi:hypothetical protein